MYETFEEILGALACAGDAADTVVLVVSELVTNALRHGGGTHLHPGPDRAPGQHRGGGT
jgi:anti-sigma regulatory factor (Ser/Thr protein kinase)